MRSLPFPTFNESHFYVSGNVVIHPSAAIAPGALLQADPDSQLVIAAGVCVGSGVVLHAHQGLLLIEAGVTLGSAVLIIGSGTIGAHACIGSQTTIIESSVPAGEFLPPRSLIGDRSRAAVESTVSASSSTQTSPAAGNTVKQRAETNGAKDRAKDQAGSAAPQPMETHVVYGRTYLERMMVTMFPHRQTPDSAE